MNFRNAPFFNKMINRSVLVLPFCLVTACGGSALSSSLSSANETLTAGANLKLLNGANYDLSQAFFDDFVGGVSSKNWYIGNGAWGSGNGGVVPANVGYSDDGVLILRGNGLYYTGNDIKGVGTLKDGRNTGAALISKFLTGPGHYEIKMKLLPRQGACTAFWTFTNRANKTGANDNHEIDIELPGGKKDGIITFKNVLNTNYVTENYYLSQDVNLKKAFSADSEICLNDGEWHTFGFDWYTNPAQVIYFIDGRVSAIGDAFVPTLQTRLWLGNWFPNNAGFVGSSYFETDYMYIDWVKYLPFDSTQPFEAYTPNVTVETAAEDAYPSAPMAYPEVNKISNGDFEYIRRDVAGDSGWSFLKLNTEKQDIASVCYPARGIGYDGSCGLHIKDGGLLRQNIDSVYEGFKYHFSFHGKAYEKGGKVVLSFVNAYEAKAIQSVTYNVTDTSWKSYGGDVTAPADCYGVRIDAYGSTGNAMDLDDLTLERS